MITAVILEKKKKDAGLLKEFKTDFLQVVMNTHTINSHVLTAISTGNRHPTVSQNYGLNDTAWKGGDCATVYFCLKFTFFPFFCSAFSEENLVYLDLVQRLW